MIKLFFQKNWVFISGLLAALAVALQQFVGNAEFSLPAVLMAVLMAGLSYLANEWRGKGATITGIIGTLAFTFVTIFNTGQFSWSQFILAAIIAILGAVAPPPKPASYETQHH